MFVISLEIFYTNTAELEPFDEDPLAEIEIRIMASYTHVHPQTNLSISL